MVLGGKGFYNGLESMFRFGEKRLIVYYCIYE